MVVYLLHLVLGRCFLSFLGRIVCTVVETVATPCGASELCPHDVVIQQLLCLHVHDVYLLPVAAAARDGVCEVFAVVAEGDVLQSHCTVIAQLVGVEEHAPCIAQFVHLVEHGLVLQSVVAVHIPLAVLLEGCVHLLVVGHFLESFQILGALWYLGQVGVGNVVLSLYPCGRHAAGVVFQRAEGVGHLSAEVFVHRSVFWGYRVFQVLPRHGHGTHCQYRCQ